MGEALGLSRLWSSFPHVHVHVNDALLNRPVLRGQFAASTCSFNSAAFNDDRFYLELEAVQDARRTVAIGPVAPRDNLLKQFLTAVPREPGSKNDTPEGERERERERERENAKRAMSV